MITEDQLEQLAIQWFRDTARVNIEHRTPNIERRSEEKRRLAAEREALRTLTPALSHGEKEEDGRLAEAVRIFGSRQISRQSVARGVVGYRDMNHDIVSRFGGDSGRKWGIATEIPTKCRDFALVARGEAQSRQLSRHHDRFGHKKAHQMGLPFRAWNPVGDGTQGVALGCRVMPRWGVGKEPGERLNKERRYPIALPMRGPLGSGLPRFMGFPWTSADGFRRSLIGIAPLGRKKGTHAAFGCE